MQSSTEKERITIPRKARRWDNGHHKTSEKSKNSKRKNRNKVKYSNGR